jgi:hypothetical protein
MNLDFQPEQLREMLYHASDIVVKYILMLKIRKFFMENPPPRYESYSMSPCPANPVKYWSSWIW